MMLQIPKLDRRRIEKTIDRRLCAPASCWAVLACRAGETHGRRSFFVPGFGHRYRLSTGRLTLPPLIEILALGTGTTGSVDAAFCHREQRRGTPAPIMSGREADDLRVTAADLGYTEQKAGEEVGSGTPTVRPGYGR